jgi:hypothetical protein
VPTPARPDERPVALRRTSWLTLAGATAIALAAIVAFPRSGGDAPPLAALALTGAVVTAVTAGALYAVVRRDLRVPTRLALSFAIAFALVGIVKFVLAPRGLYEVNAVRPLQEVVGTVGDPLGALLTAASVLGLYALVYAVVYRLARRRSLTGQLARGTVVVGGLVLAALVVTGIAFLAFFVLLAPIEYVSFVFGSGAGLLVASALVGSAALLTSVFRALGGRPELVVEVGSIVTLFWLGLGFLALYHALWLVYVLVLGSIWPLRTVVPK